jgi:mRNA interferase YafQ
MLEIYQTSSFKKDRKRELRNPNNQDLDLRIVEILSVLINKKPVPRRFKLHRLKGSYAGYLECHVKPDLLMIFRIETKRVYLFRLGSHSNLFR